MNKRQRKYIEELIKQKNKPNINDSQILIVKTLAKGETLKDSAKLLNINYNNFQKQVQKLYRLFNVNSRLELITKALDFKFIKYSNIYSKFRKRFVYKNNQTSISNETENIKLISLNDTENYPKITENLTEEEIKYINLIARGFTKKYIISELRLCNMYTCNVLGMQICAKLNAKNLRQAVIYAFLLNIIK